MKWILQDQGYALGNFINVTPIIKWLYEKTGEKVPVFFETKYVKECYLTSPYILHLKEKPTNEPFASSAMINRSNDKPDFMYAFELVTKERYSETYRPFIDEIHSGFGDSVLIMNGSGSMNSKYVELKNPGVEIYEKMIIQLMSMGKRIVFTGNSDDLERMKPIRNLFECDFIDDIRFSLVLVRESKFIITNDTGLAHAAGCFDKPQLVLWKDTKFTKNMNSGKNTVYAQKNEWLKVFEQIKNTI
jgi:ADP-heptose:LPS heptosyltransferase